MAAKKKKTNKYVHQTTVHKLPELVEIKSIRIGDIRTKNINNNNDRKL